MLNINKHKPDFHQTIRVTHEQYAKGVIVEDADGFLITVPWVLVGSDRLSYAVRYPQGKVLHDAILKVEQEQEAAADRENDVVVLYLAEQINHALPRRDRVSKATIRKVLDGIENAGMVVAGGGALTNALTDALSATPDLESIPIEADRLRGLVVAHTRRDAGVALDALD